MNFKGVFRNFGLEKEINNYKEFYKAHLYHIKDRNRILDGLQKLFSEFKSLDTISLVENAKRKALDESALEFFNMHFKRGLIEQYNRIPEFKSRYKADNSDNFLMSVGKSWLDLKDLRKHEWDYKINLINFIYNCLFCFGLHPNISLRDLSLKRYNLIIKHFYRSTRKQTIKRTMMTYDQFNTDFTSQYISKKPIKIGGIIIPFDDIHQIKITTTLLKEDEIELFALKNNFNWTEKRKDEITFINNCLDETETYHSNPYKDKVYNLLQVDEVKLWSARYPSSFNLYKQGLDKFEKQDLHRNLLDDLRLSLELLLKEMLGNNKSLENQLSEIGIFQTTKGGSPEATNMFHKLIDYYSKYQNNYVKHNDNVQKSEIELVIDLTTTFIKYFIKP